MILWEINISWIRIPWLPCLYSRGVTSTNSQKEIPWPERNIFQLAKGLFRQKSIKATFCVKQSFNGNNLHDTSTISWHRRLGLRWKRARCWHCLSVLRLVSVAIFRIKSTKKILNHFPRVIQLMFWRWIFEEGKHNLCYLHTPIPYQNWILWDAVLCFPAKLSNLIMYGAMRCG